MCLFLISHACFITAYASARYDGRTLSTHEKWFLPCECVRDKDGRTLSHGAIIVSHTLECPGRMARVQSSPKAISQSANAMRNRSVWRAGFALSLPNTRIDSWWEWIRNMSFCRDYYPSQPISQAVMMTADGPLIFVLAEQTLFHWSDPEQKQFLKTPATLHGEIPEITTSIMRSCSFRGVSFYSGIERLKDIRGFIVYF